MKFSNIVLNLSLARRCISNYKPPPPITVTKKAIKEVSKIKQISSKPYMLFSAKGGGCGGFEYSFVPTSKIDPKDIEIKLNDTTVHVDHMSEMVLLGTTIDFQEIDYSKGFLHNRFNFIPKKNLATTCGCGVSFAPNFENIKKQGSLN